MLEVISVVELFGGSLQSVTSVVTNTEGLENALANTHIEEDFIKKMTDDGFDISDEEYLQECVDSGHYEHPGKLELFLTHSTDAKSMFRIQKTAMIIVLNDGRLESQQQILLYDKAQNDLYEAAKHEVFINKCKELSEKVGIDWENDSNDERELVLDGEFSLFEEGVPYQVFLSEVDNTKGSSKIIEIGK